MLPGSVRQVVVPALERGSGKLLGEGFGVCFNPEFLREGSSVQDHYHPPYTLIGAWERPDGERAALLYASVKGEVCHVSVETAEMVKYVCNAFHALKITFANEMGMLGQACGVDGQVVMDLVCRDKKLNISSRYLAPGFAFGGSCLPKDLRALLSRARDTDTDLPLTHAILESNRTQIDRAIQIVLSTRRRRIGLMGISFKAGTDDLRESPLVVLAEALIGKGLDLRICDPAVALARLVGANREYIEREIPHLSALMVADVRAVVEHAELLVVGNDAPEFGQLSSWLRPGQTVLDLVGKRVGAGVEGVEYRGIAW
jgi:GDP-mannose 6-dehydrogenase